MNYQWTKAKGADDPISLAIRRDVRLHRREHGRGGHRYRYATVKSIWHVDQIHAVINHTDDPVWQYWYNDPREGWRLVHWYDTRREAQAAAEMPHIPESSPVVTTKRGLYVLARWPKQDYKMKVYCSSPRIAGEMISIFESIGCETVHGDDQLVDSLTELLSSESLSTSVKTWIPGDDSPADIEPANAENAS